MSKQEEIRARIEQFIDTYYGEFPNSVLAGMIADDLHSQGVVIKVESGYCPAHGYPLPCDKCGAPKGTWSVEPLIKEE